MGLRARLVLMILVASLGPLLVLGIGATEASSRALQAKVADLQAGTAVSLARGVDSVLDQRLSVLERQVASYPVESLDDDGLAAFVRLVYKQTDDARIVSIFDRSTRQVLHSAHLDAPVSGELSDRAVVTQAESTAWAAAVPGLVSGVTELPQSGWLGTPRRIPGGNGFFLPMLYPAGPTGRLVLAIELGLDAVAGTLAGHAETVDVALLDQEGRIIFDGSNSLVDAQVFLPLKGTRSSEVQYTTDGGLDVQAACAPVAVADWSVIVAQPLAEILAPVQDIKKRAAFILAVSAVLAVVLGVLMARDVSVPVIALRDAALAVADGQLGRVVSATAAGEVGDLGRAFNFMSERLERNREEIDLKNAEIESFNEELQQRVEDRTRELREAQQQLVQSARLAAVGEMGAGLAHELNNPVAGILGLAQVLRAKRTGTPDEHFLRSIEEQAVRCKDIVAQMQRFSQSSAPDERNPRAAHAVVDLDLVVTDVLALVGGAMRDRGVVVEREATPGLRTRGDAAELGRALAQLMSSVRGAAAPGSRVHLEGRRRDGQVELDLVLRGPELRVGADDWKASGMGFWAASQVFSAHGGALQEITVDPEGSAASAGWRVILPGA